MASIVKRGSSWRVQIKDVKRNVRETKTFRLKAEAVAWAQAREAELEKGAPLGKRTVRQALRRYAEEESPKKRGERWEVVRLKKFENTLPFVDMPLSDVGPSAIAEWRDSQSTSPGTVKREMVLLQSVLEVCVKEWQWLAVNPVRGVRKPSPPRARNRIFTDAEVEAICEHLTGPVGALVAVVFRLALETAMRSGEIVSLTKGQVDLESRVVHLEKTKNGDDRDVPLSLVAVSLFQALDAFRAAKVASSQSVFNGLSDSSRDTLWRKARDAAGVKGATFHDSRATALTRLAARLDVLTLARIAGHRDLKSLQVYYREPAESIALRLD